MRAHVFEHEMQHVAIYNAAVLRAQIQLESEMRAHFNERQLVGDAAPGAKTTAIASGERFACLTNLSENEPGRGRLVCVSL